MTKEENNLRPQLRTLARKAKIAELNSTISAAPTLAEVQKAEATRTEMFGSAGRRGRKDDRGLLSGLAGIVNNKGKISFDSALQLVDVMGSNPDSISQQDLKELARLVNERIAVIKEIARYDLPYDYPMRCKIAITFRKRDNGGHDIHYDVIPAASQDFIENKAIGELVNKELEKRDIPTGPQLLRNAI